MPVSATLAHCRGHRSRLQMRRSRSSANHLDACSTQTRSFNCVLPALRAQWTQQKICPSASTPCPTIRQLQCGQTGASAWIAHSKLSNVWCFPPTTTSKALSYSFSQTSHVAIHKCFARRELRGGAQLILRTETAFLDSIFRIGDGRCRSERTE